mgnify:CR=1 FL=1
METDTITIPPKERDEWLLIVTSKIDHKFQNFVLQMKTAEYARKIASDSLTPQQAVDEIYALCEKYSLAVHNDLKVIFKEW